LIPSDLLFSFTLFQTFQTAADIVKYKKVHTGPNTQFGGLKLGRVISAYQDKTFFDVMNPAGTEIR
jgi:hypothetical protein